MAENDRFTEGYAVGRDSNGCYNQGGGFGFGGEWGGLIGLLIVASLFGNGGFGFGGGIGGCGRGACATQAEVRAAVDQQTLISKLDQQTYGLADSAYAINNTLNSNFRSLDNAICTLGYQNQAGINSLSYQNQAGVNQISNLIQSCCCDLKTMNLENRYLNEKQTCDIVGAVNAASQRWFDMYTADKMASKDLRIATLESAIANRDQTDTLLKAINRDRCPEPAYLVPNPNCCYNYNVTGFGYGQSGCGSCGC